MELSQELVGGHNYKILVLQIHLKNQIKEIKLQKCLSTGQHWFSAVAGLPTPETADVWGTWPPLVNTQETQTCF